MVIEALQGPSHFVAYMDRPILTPLLSDNRQASGSVMIRNR